MPRVTNGTLRSKRRKKILKLAKGYWGRRSTNFRVAKDAIAKAGLYAYRDRKRKKRDFRRLWIIRISAACRSLDITYSQFMLGIKRAGVELDRKALAHLAVEDPSAFASIVETARKEL